MISKLSSLLILLALVSNPSLFAQAGKCPVKIVITNYEMIPQQGEQIWLVGQTNGTVVKGVSNAKGEVSMEVLGGDKYDIKVKSIGDALEYSTVEVPVLEKNQRYGTLSIGIKYELPKTFTLDNVLFDTGKSTLRASSYVELNELVELLKRKKNMTIELGGHTDNQGSEASNLTLSQNRANAVKKYLISKGIDASRIAAVGYGESQPVADNETSAGRQANRRTEVQIVKR